MKHEHQMTPDEEREFDRLDARGDMNATMARAAITGEAFGEVQPARKNRSKAHDSQPRRFTPGTEVQPYESEVDPHWPRTVDYLSEDQKRLNDSRLAEIRANLGKS